MLAGDVLDIFLLGSFGVMVCVMVYFQGRRMLFRRRAGNLDLPAGLPSVAVGRYASYYLRKHGWILDPVPPDRTKIYVRASRNGQNLNIFVPAPNMTSFRQQLRDAEDCATRLRQVVTVLTYGVDPAELDLTPAPPRILYMQPKQLSDAEKMLRNHRAGRSQ